ncbi:MAG: transcription termination/antitermination NusG family protein [Flavisolibacter sp.]
MKKWLIITTRPRWEKKALDILCAKGIEAFCPLNKVHRQWSDRVKVIYEPLFRGLVFVKITEGEKPLVRTTPGVVNFLYRDGKLAGLREKQVQQLKDFLEQHVMVSLLPLAGQENGNGHLVNGAEDNGAEKRKFLKLQTDHFSYIIYSTEASDSIAQ